MPWTIPDKGEGDNDIQSILFQEYLDVLVAGLTGVDCVLSGFVFTSNLNMQPTIGKGAILSNRIMYAVAQSNVTITTADSTNPRIDLIVVTSAGALAVRAGTPAAAPKPPARTANDVVLYAVYVPASDIIIGSSQLVDLRTTPPFPIVIYRTTTQEVTNNTSGVIHILNKTGSGVSIPNGLLQAGSILRVCIRGNALFNSGTPTNTIIISFGGVTWFSDVTAAAAADADRRAWTIEFNIYCTSTTVQHIVGMINIQVQAATITAPTTGIAGEIGGTTGATASIISPIEGAAGSVNTDNANNTLAVTWTMNVANASDEIVVEGATVELI